MAEEDKYDTIDPRNSRIVNSNITDANKIETIRDNKRYFDLPRNSALGLSNDFKRIDHSYFRSSNDPNSDLKGYLLLIRWGHNGNFSIQEKSDYEKHLVKAGFIKMLISQNDYHKYNEE